MSLNRKLVTMVMITNPHKQCQYFHDILVFMCVGRLSRQGVTTLFSLEVMTPEMGRVSLEMVHPGSFGSPLLFLPHLKVVNSAMETCVSVK